MLIDIPFFKALVRSKYLNPDTDGYEPCYIFAATVLPSRPLLLTCHTESGAVFSRLPLSAFCTTPCEELEQGIVEPYGVIAPQACAIKHAYLKDYEIEDMRSGRKGVYLFTIDQFGGGWGEDPEQHKTFNVGAYDSGQIFALPNNYVRFIDTHFIDKDRKPRYSRQSKYWRV